MTSCLAVPQRRCTRPPSSSGASLVAEHNATMLRSDMHGEAADGDFLPAEVWMSVLDACDGADSAVRRARVCSTCQVLDPDEEVAIESRGVEVGADGVRESIALRLLGAGAGDGAVLGAART